MHHFNINEDWLVKHLLVPANICGRRWYLFYPCVDFVVPDAIDDSVQALPATLDDCHFFYIHSWLIVTI